MSRHFLPGASVTLNRASGYGVQYVADAYEKEIVVRKLIAMLLAGSIFFSSGAFAAGNVFQFTSDTVADFSYSQQSVSFNWNWNNIDLGWIVDYIKKLVNNTGNGGENGGGHHAVPEMDAAGGIIAFSLALALFGLLRERRRQYLS